jgi:hypothetical protein
MPMQALEGGQSARLSGPFNPGKDTVNTVQEVESLGMGLDGIENFAPHWDSIPWTVLVLPKMGEIIARNMSS